MGWPTTHRNVAGVAAIAFIAGAVAATFLTRLLQPSLNKGAPDEIFNTLMLGPSAVTYRLKSTVIKIPHCDDEEALITQENYKAMRNEANVYLILGDHPRIAKCLFIGLLKDMVVLEYYPRGNLREHISKHPDVSLEQKKKWAREMIEGVVAIHRNGIRHSDLRLDQWLVDNEDNARLCDFNSSGFDAVEALGLEATAATGLEPPSHFMPRDPEAENTVRSDLFALGSSLYELDKGDTPFSDKDEETITELYEAGLFPSLDGLHFGSAILGCWKGDHESAADLLLDRQLQTT